MPQKKDGQGKSIHGRREEGSEVIIPQKLECKAESIKQRAYFLLLECIIQSENITAIILYESNIASTCYDLK